MTDLRARPGDDDATARLAALLEAHAVHPTIYEDLACGCGEWFEGDESGTYGDHLLAVWRQQEVRRRALEAMAADDADLPEEAMRIGFPKTR